MARWHSKPQVARLQVKSHSMRNTAPQCRQHDRLPQGGRLMQRDLVARQRAGESRSEAELHLRAAASSRASQDPSEHCTSFCPLIHPELAHWQGHWSATLAYFNAQWDFLNVFFLKRAMENIHHVLFGKPPSAPRMPVFTVRSYQQSPLSPNNTKQQL